MTAMLMLAATAGAAPAAEYRLLELGGSFIKWGTARFGTGATVRYALLQGKRDDQEAINCKSMTGLQGLLGRAGLDAARFRERLQSAFAMWHAVADISFVPAMSAATADIVIGAQAEPRGIAYTNIQHEPESGSQFAKLGQTTICLNPEMPWRAGGKSEAKALSYELRSVLAHEIGHALGLDHPGRWGELMAYSYQDDLEYLTDGDIAGIVTLYGVPAPATGD